MHRLPRILLVVVVLLSGAAIAPSLALPSQSIQLAAVCRRLSGFLHLPAADLQGHALNRRSRVVVISATCESG